VAFLSFEEIKNCFPAKLKRLNNKRSYEEILMHFAIIFVGLLLFFAFLKLFFVSSALFLYFFNQLMFPHYNFDNITDGSCYLNYTFLKDLRFICSFTLTTFIIIL
jgi:hypothetical protein